MEKTLTGFMFFASIVFSALFSFEAAMENGGAATGYAFLAIVFFVVGVAALAEE